MVIMSVELVSAGHFIARCQTSVMEVNGQESDKAAQDTDKDHRLVYV